MFLSIIVPVFQAEKYISRCVGSVLKQKGDFELILIDDGSTDNSLRICKFWQSKDKRVKVLSHSNQGVAYTRNVGLSHANGKYVLFLDADDEIASNALEIYKTCIDQQEEPDIVISGYRTVLKRKELNSFETNFLKQTNVSHDNLDDFFWKLFNSNLLHNIGTKVYKREVLVNNSIKFNNEISVCEDVIFCIKAMRICDKIIVLPDVLYIYNIEANASSLNHIYRKGMYGGVCELYATILELPIKINEKFYNSFQNALIEVLYNEFRNTIFCYVEIKNIVRKYKENSLINKLFYKQKCYGNRRSRLLYKNQLSSLYISLLLKYLYEKFSNMKIWTECFDVLYFVYKKTIRNVIKK